MRHGKPQRFARETLSLRRSQEVQKASPNRLLKAKIVFPLWGSEARYCSGSMNTSSPPVCSANTMSRFRASAPDHEGLLQCARECALARCHGAPYPPEQRAMDQQRSVLPTHMKALRFPLRPCWLDVTVGRKA